MYKIDWEIRENSSENLENISRFTRRIETAERFEEIEKLIGSLLIEHHFGRELFRTRAPVLLTENRVGENWVRSTISRG